MLTHIDLFSGIGGFALAAQWAGFRTEVFCEIEPFCQEILKQRFGAIADSESMGRRNGTTENERTSAGKIDTPSDTTPILIPDIRGFDGRRFRGATLLTAGVPCQPASIAGKRKGTTDDRWLWPETFRILAEVKPAWTIFENPCGILSLERGVVFENLLSQMEAEGYEVQPVIIPACAVNAPHRRDRVWIIAYDSRSKKSGRIPNIGRKKVAEIRQTDSDAPDAKGRETKPPEQGRFYAESGGKNFNAPDPEGRGRGQGNQDSRGTQERKGTPRPGNRSSYGGWDEAWPEVATRLCRMDDGVPKRVDRLKALGNAIVPQIAYEIIKRIAEIENARKP